MVRASSIFCVARKRSSAIPTILKVNGNTTRMQRIRVISVSRHLHSPAFGPSAECVTYGWGAPPPPPTYLCTYMRCLKPTVEGRDVGHRRVATFRCYIPPLPFS